MEGQRGLLQDFLHVGLPGEDLHRGLVDNLPVLFVQLVMEDLSEWESRKPFWKVSVLTLIQQMLRCPLWLTPIAMLI